ncbi:MAG: hypothetical protein U1C33_03430 [Candidatus Cloacimonadaceae bacterium]|nr:hypothetical protein [Candidatus Cloacimonadaceae bacterium]
MKGILIVFAVLMFSALLFANPVWDTPINIRKTHSIDLSESYATAADGSTIYVWSDVSSGSRDIYAQRIDHLGNKIWQEPLALTSSAGSQDYPVIKAYNTNEFVIAYYDYHENSEGNIRVIKINLAGTQLWQEGGVIASSSTGSKKEMKLLVVNQDLYLVWSERMSGDKKLHGQRLNSLGNRQWGQL